MDFDLNRTIQLTASRLTAAAVCSILPGAEIVEMELSLGGFTCEFFCEDPFSSDLLILLEEQVRGSIQKGLSIRSLEMVPFSASEWLLKKGQPIRAEAVLDQSGLVTLFQMDSFLDWGTAPFCANTSDVGFIRLFEMTSHQKNFYKIRGVSSPSKKEITSYLKKWRAFTTQNHQEKGRELGLWDFADENWIYLPFGLEVEANFRQFWLSNLPPLSMEVRGSGAFFAQIAKRYDAPRIAEFIYPRAEKKVGERGLLDAKDSLLLKINSLSPQEDCNSLLQFIDRSLTMLGFTYRLRFLSRKGKDGAIRRSLKQCNWIVEEQRVSGEPILEFLVQDLFHCEWVVASVQQSVKQVELLTTVWIERNLALLIERSDGLLPEWLNTALFNTKRGCRSKG